MRLVVLALCALGSVTGPAAADVRVAGSVHGTMRMYDNGFSESGFGPGLSVVAEQSHRKFAQGLYLGWHTYDEDLHNAQAHSRVQLVQVHYYVDRTFKEGALGFGIGLDEAFRANYSTDGAYSYSDRDTLLAINIQLALNVATLANGSRFGVATGFGIFPLIDVAPILTHGEVDVGWRGITGSLGVFWQPAS